MCVANLGHEHVYSCQLTYNACVFCGRKQPEDGDLAIVDHGPEVF